MSKIICFLFGFLWVCMVLAIVSHVTGNKGGVIVALLAALMTIIGIATFAGHDIGKKED